MKKPARIFSLCSGVNIIERDQRGHGRTGAREEADGIGAGDIMAEV